MYLDNLWNLITVNFELNSSKGNRLLAGEIIIRLDERNRRLLNLLKSSAVRSKHLNDPDLAVVNRYLMYHWIGVKG